MHGVTSGAQPAGDVLFLLLVLFVGSLAAGLFFGAPRLLRPRDGDARSADERAAARLSERELAELWSTRPPARPEARRAAGDSQPWSTGLARPTAPGDRSLQRDR